MPLTAALQPPLPQSAWLAWNRDPLLLIGLALVAFFYARGIIRLWRRAGAGRAVSPGQVLAFGAGWFVLLIALVSPLDAISGALLSAHMVQHLLLMLVAAPLLVLGAPPVALGWGTPRSGSLARWWHRRTALRHAWQALTRPAVAWSLHLLLLWLWHLPALYQAALLDDGVHVLEHLTFLGAALLYWWTLLRRRSLSFAPGVLYLFTTALLSGLLGVLLTFSERVWYPAYGVLPYGWGFTPLQDQQLAGVIMWFPGGLIYVAAVLLFLGTALQRREREEGSAGVVVAPRRPVEAQG